VVAGRPRNRFCLLDSLDLAPIIGRRVNQTAPVAGIGQKEFVRSSVFRVPATTVFCHPEKAKGFVFANGRCNGFTGDSVFDEILERYRQSAVVVAAVVCKLDFDSIKQRSR